MRQFFSRFRFPYIDLPDRLRHVLTPFATQVLFGIVCAAASLGLRWMLDLWFPDAGPFALTIPAVLLATLFGRWIAGGITLALSQIYAWYFVLPIQGSFDFSVTGDKQRVIVNMGSGFFVVVLAEMFRRAFRRALADREMLLVELEHRVKNNFSSITSLLRLQLRNCNDPDIQYALNTALGRVESFARANSFLYQAIEYKGAIDLRSYLIELCRAISSALYENGSVRFHCEIEPVEFSRDRAILVGLLVNEVVTNSAKYAFTSRETGDIHVKFISNRNGYLLTIADNGGGISGCPREGNLGMKLVEELSQQTRGQHRWETSERGTVFYCEFAP